VRVALLQLGNIQEGRSTNLQSLMAAIDRAASNDPGPDLLVLPATGDVRGMTAGQNGLFASIAETIAWKAREWGVYVAAGLSVLEVETTMFRSFLFDPDGDIVARTGAATSGKQGAAEDLRSWFSSPVGRFGLVDPQTASVPTSSTDERCEGGFLAYPLPSLGTPAQRRAVTSSLESLRAGASDTLGTYWGVAGRAEASADAGKAGHPVTFVRDPSGTVIENAAPSCETVLYADVDLPPVRGESRIDSQGSDDHTG